MLEGSFPEPLGCRWLRRLAVAMLGVLAWLCGAWGPPGMP
jgi:hypothetical protein